MSEGDISYFRSADLVEVISYNTSPITWGSSSIDWQWTTAIAIFSVSIFRTASRNDLAWHARLFIRSQKLGLQFKVNAFNDRRAKRIP